MKPGTTADFTGTVRTWTRRGANGPVVTELHDGGASITAVWWNADNVPAIGTRVSVSGDVKTFAGQLELHVRRHRSERPLPDDPYARLVGYYLECVEAEAASDLTVSAGGAAHLPLEEGTAPPYSRDPLPLPATDRAIAWAQRRRSSLGETLLAGYPIIVGRTPATPYSVSASPLFVTEVLLVDDVELGPVLRPTTQSIDLNLAALELIGVQRDEREEIQLLLDGSVEYEDAANPEDKLRVALELIGVTLGRGIVPTGVDPRALQPIDTSSEGMQNSCLVIASQGGSQMTRQLIDDLESIMQRPHDLRGGPLGIFLGAAAATPTPFPRGHPVVVPSTVRQGQAIHAAMTEPFTVITGPPGTGKSQALVNAVAAIVTAGETVAFASKNNKAVDVVVDRLRAASPNSNVMRCGSAKLRTSLSTAIGDALDRALNLQPSPPMPRDQQLERRVDAAFDRLRERAHLIQALSISRQHLQSLRSGLPPGADMSIDLEKLSAVEGAVLSALGAFGQALPRVRFWRRWPEHQRRLEHARASLASLNGLLRAHRFAEIDAAMTLQSVSAKPRRSLAPSGEFVGVRSLIGLIEEIRLTEAQVLDQQHLLDTEYQVWAIEDALAALAQERIADGRNRLRQLWPRLVREHPAAQAELQLLQADLLAGSKRVRDRFKNVLPALPAWGVTSLSVSANFPLERGLFDLVIIDEASQCDVASIIPLLYRAKRALIIGDQRQLTHITQLGQVRNELIARRWHIGQPTLATFDYRTRSAFGLAVSRVGEPLLLDLHFRSQPSIITFSNRQFYGGQLSICTPGRIGAADEPALEWLQIAGRAERGTNGKSWLNRGEAEAVVYEILRLLPMVEGTGQSLGVVTPFRPQADEIQRLLTAKTDGAPLSITIDSAHRFQGDERDIMILSPVVAPGMAPTGAKFAGDPNLLNVALTRARNRLVVVGDQAACLAASGTALADFAQYVARLEASGFDSPLELELFEALLARGIPTEPGRLVSGHRLDLAVELHGRRLDIECDGAAFHKDRVADETRDATLRYVGWEVVRFSGRELSRDVDACAVRIEELLAHPSAS